MSYNIPITPAAGKQHPSQPPPPGTNYPPTHAPGAYGGVDNSAYAGYGGGYAASASAVAYPSQQGQAQYGGGYQQQQQAPAYDYGQGQQGYTAPGAYSTYYSGQQQQPAAYQPEYGSGSQSYHTAGTWGSNPPAGGGSGVQGGGYNANGGYGTSSSSSSYGRGGTGGAARGGRGGTSRGGFTSDVGGGDFGGYGSGFKSEVGSGSGGYGQNGSGFKSEVGSGGGFGGYGQNGSGFKSEVGSGGGAGGFGGYGQNGSGFKSEVGSGGGFGGYGQNGSGFKSEVGSGGGAGGFGGYGGGGDGFGRGGGISSRGRGGDSGSGRGGGGDRNSFGRGRGSGMSDRGRGSSFGSERGGRGGFSDRGGRGGGGTSFDRGGSSFGGGRGRGGGGESGFGGGGGGEGGFGRGGGDRGRGRGGGDRGRGMSSIGGGSRGRGGFGSDSGRGGGGDNRGRGGFGSDSGGRGGGRGRGFGDRGRGVGGGGGRGGGGDRGRGFSSRGGGDRGRGFSSRGGGGRGGGFSSGGGRGGGFQSKETTLFTSSSGVGLASLGDVIKSAKSRQFQQMDNVQPCLQTDPLPKLIEHWKSFLTTFIDCGNAISTIESSLIASKVRFLRLNYDSKPLTQCSKFQIFTGSLSLVKVKEGLMTGDAVFTARGLGLTKKNAKLDAYQKAYRLITNATVAEIMSQEDTNDSALIQEVTCLFNEDRNGFLALLKKSTEEGGEEGTQDMVNASMKRPATARGDGGPPKRLRLNENVAAMLEISSTSLVPKKQSATVMNPNDTLFDKVTKLKQLLKEEGITKLHIVPKIDQLGHKCSLSIKNVYRYVRDPYVLGPLFTPVICEIFFDGIFMSRGDPEVKRIATMHSAYTFLANRLCQEPLDSIVHCSTFWQDYMERDPDIAEVRTKIPGEDNDSLLTSNLANMKQMMQSNPDFSLTLDKFVIMEFESDAKMENSYKMLELSATRNCMLLECEIVRNEENRFTCITSLQGKRVAMKTHNSKNGAKRACSDAILLKLNRTNNIVYIGKDLQGPIYTRDQLVEEAKKAKADGLAPLKFCLKKEDNNVPEFKTHESRLRWEDDKVKSHQMEQLPENIADQPYIPWMARVLADHLLKFHKQVSLLDLRVYLHDMPKSMRDMVQIVAGRMGLRTVSKLRESDNAILRRSVTAIELTKILGVSGGESGRFKMKQCKNPWPSQVLEKYKEEMVTKYSKMYEELINEVDPDAKVDLPSS